MTSLSLLAFRTVAVFPHDRFLTCIFIEVSEGRDTLTEGRHEFNFAFDLPMG